MSRQKKLLTIILLVIIGMAILLIATTITYVNFVMFFEQCKIELHQFIIILLFVVGILLNYIYIFDIAIRKQIYDVRLDGQQYIILSTLFKEITINRKDIIDKKMSFWGRGEFLNSYKIKIENESKIKTFYISLGLYDRLKL